MYAVTVAFKNSISQRFSLTEQTAMTTCSSVSQPEVSISNVTRLPTHARYLNT